MQKYKKNYFLTDILSEFCIFAVCNCHSERNEVESRNLMLLNNKHL